MKRIAAAAAAAGAGLAMLVAAPARSTDTDRQAADLEMVAPLDALGSAKPGEGAVYEPVRAPARFTMLGFSWQDASDPAIAVRVSEDGSDWGPWTPVPAQPDGGPDPSSDEATASGRSAPVWAGRSRYVQYRLSQAPEDLRLRLIDTDALAAGQATAAKGSDGFATDTETETSADDDRDDRSDEDDRRDEDRRDRGGDSGDKRIVKQIVPRKKWDPKNRCKPRRKSKKGKVGAAIVHHTVNANRYSKDESAEMVLGICRFHRNGNGWDDIGYNFVVDRFGQVFEGRNGGIKRANVGAQAVGFNESTTGIANLGTFQKEAPDKKALKAQGKLIAWLSEVHDFPTKGKVKVRSDGGSGNQFDKGKVKIEAISGHRDVTKTDCPGDKLYKELKKIRKLAS